MELKKMILTQELFKNLTQFSDMTKIKLATIREISFLPDLVVFYFDGKEHVNAYQMPYLHHFSEFSQNEITLIKSMVNTTEEIIRDGLHPEGLPKRDIMIIDIHLDSFLKIVDEKLGVYINGLVCEKLTMDGKKADVTKLTWNHVKQITEKTGGWSCVEKCADCYQEHGILKNSSQIFSRSKLDLYSFVACKILSNMDPKIAVFYFDGKEHVNIHYMENPVVLRDFGCDEIQFIDKIAHTMYNLIQNHRGEEIEKYVITDIHSDNHILMDQEGPPIIKLQFITSCSFLTSDEIQIDMKKLTWKQYVEAGDDRKPTCMSKVTE